MQTNSRAGPVSQAFLPSLLCQSCTLQPQLSTPNSSFSSSRQHFLHFPRWWGPHCPPIGWVQICPPMGAQCERSGPADVMRRSYFDSPAALSPSQHTPTAVCKESESGTEPVLLGLAGTLTVTVVWCGVV